MNFNFTKSCFFVSFLFLSAISTIQSQDAGISAFLDPDTPPDSYALIQVSLRNYGTDTLKSVSIFTEINGIAKNPYNYSAAKGLAPGRKLDLYVTGFRFNSNGTYNIKVYTSNPNGTMDSNVANDTLNYTLKGALDLENLDAGILSIVSPSTVSEGSKLVRVRLKNFGIEPIDSVTIAWRINGVEQRPYLYKGPTLRSRREIDLYIGRVRFKEGEEYTISARTESPNGGVDEKPGNNRVAREYN